MRGLLAGSLAILIWIGAGPSSSACTCFLVDREDGLFVGRNYDWDFSDGLVLVNPRGLVKPVSLDPELDAGTWEARYGSVTFNQYGRDFPTGGMNERGLVVEVLWLNGTVFPPEDARLALDTLHWIQYQLDTAATVDEVVGSLERVRVRGAVSVHFYLADRTGEAAALEFLGGQLVVHRTSDSMPAAVLTNHTYAESEEYLRSCQGWGGERPIDRSTRSLARFARASAGARELAGKPDAIQPAEIFRLLEDVSQGDRTQWSIVYDLKRLRVDFRTEKNPDIRSIDLATIDFSCQLPVRMIDVDRPVRGDLAELWSDYQRAANRDLIGRSYRKTEFLHDTPKATLDRLAAYPERATCAGSAPRSP